jgi:glycosyltransferase involved in cell wall biosynthesis
MIPWNAYRKIGRKLPIVLIFGYPNNTIPLGGTIWIKKVADYIEKSDVLSIRKVSCKLNAGVRFFSRLYRSYAVLKGCFMNPDITILDTYGEASLLMWIMLRFFRPSAKIVTIFHHYEPRSIKRKNGGTLTLIYCRILDYLTRIMLDNSDNIMTVSLASSHELKVVLKIQDSSKITVVGCSNSTNLPMVTSGAKDIDFLCVGRFEKFYRIEDIWNIIKEKNYRSKFVVIGRASSDDILRLHTIGIDHKGIVSDYDKYQLYSRAKVFIFPSIFEGFGIAMTEAVAAGMPIVAWKIPVFEERFGHQSSNVRLVEAGKLTLFAHEAISALADCNKPHEPIPNNTVNYLSTKSWQDVAKEVISVLNRYTIEEHY